MPWSFLPIQNKKNKRNKIPWSDVFKSKYIKDILVVELGNKYFKFLERLSSCPFSLKNRSVWKVSNGISILVGEDLIWVVNTFLDVLLI